AGTPRPVRLYGLVVGPGFRDRAGGEAGGAPGQGEDLHHRRRRAAGLPVPEGRPVLRRLHLSGRPAGGPDDVDGGHVAAESHEAGDDACGDLLAGDSDDSGQCDADVLHGTVTEIGAGRDRAAPRPRSARANGGRRVSITISTSAPLAARLRQLQYFWSPRQTFADLFAKAWMEAAIPFSVLVALLLVFATIVPNFASIYNA